ncbi:hypothetical protein WT08_13815 [Burkholderia sp. MSMB1552]|nr:hypothetical protein WT08_13815 [Burkholderia sp. MSMB1552]KWZ55054.1 hypothetical protein WS92_03355 [Burkholderia sp. MSMB1588]
MSKNHAQKGALARRRFARSADMVHSHGAPCVAAARRAAFGQFAGMPRGASGHAPDRRAAGALRQSDARRRRARVSKRSDARTAGGEQSRGA